jgi:hypothetical protein
MYRCLRLNSLIKKTLNKSPGIALQHNRNDAEEGFAVLVAGATMPRTLTLAARDFAATRRGGALRAIRVVASLAKGATLCCASLVAGSTRKAPPRPRGLVQRFHEAAFTVGAALIAAHTLAATPAHEKAFVESFQKAHESKDIKTLHGFLYTKGSDPMVLDMYKMMVTMGAGEKLSSVELVDLTPEDQKKAANATGPNGRPLVSALKPTKKLVLKKVVNTPNQKSTSSSSVMVAEHEGKFVIPVPGLGK